MFEGQKFSERYEVVSELGQGTFSRVYECYDNILERNVALKVVSVAAQYSTESIDYLLREAKLLAKLNNKYIVSIYDIFRYNDHLIYVLELLKGATLQEYIQNHCLPDNTSDIMLGITEALIEAHSKNIIHGDLKPANIVFSDNKFPKVIDFGLAKLVTYDQSTLIETINSSQNISGTLPYLAPEIIHGNSPDKRSDIFALGAIFYEIFSGIPAFLGETSAHTLHKILYSKLPAIERVDSEISNFIEAMLVKDPAQRLHTLEPLAKYLAEHKIKKKEYRVDIRHSSHRDRSFINRLYQAAHSKLIVAISSSLIFLTILFFLNNRHNINLLNSIPASIEKATQELSPSNPAGSSFQAKKIFEQILMQNPDNAAATAGLALSLFKVYAQENKDPAILARAKSTARHSITLDDKLAISNLAYATSLEFDGHYEQALTAYKTALVLEPENEGALIGLAWTNVRLGDVKEGQAILINAIKTADKRPSYYQELATIQANSQQYSDAIENYKQAIDLNPYHIHNYSNLAGCEYLLGKKQEAIKTLQAGLMIKPHSLLYSNLGTYLFFEKQYAQATDAFEKAIDILGGVHRYQLWANLADSYWLLEGRKQDAIVAYNRAIDLMHTQFPKWQDNIDKQSKTGLYYAKIGEYEKAKQHALNATSLSPENARVVFRAAITSEISGDRDSAISYLKQSLNLNFPQEEIEATPELSDLRLSRSYHILLSKQGANSD